MFSRAFADEYSIAMGEAADDVAVEVSSPVSPHLSPTNPSKLADDTISASEAHAYSMDC